MPLMIWPVLGLVLVGFLISLPVTAVLVRAGRRMKTLDTAGAAGHEKTGLRAVPNIGGIAIYLAVGLPLAGGLIVLWLIGEETWRAWLPALAEHLPRVKDSTPTAVAMLICLTALHIIGLIDDRRSLPAWPKLVVQLLAAAVMALWFEVRLLTLLGPALSIIVTILWIVVITNAINFLDNMDGLAGGVSAIAAALFMTATILNHQWFIAGTLALLVGGLCAFLIFNFPPAKIFMGDGGSLIIGFLLAILTARTTFYSPGQDDYALGTAWYGLFMPIVVLAIPLYDFTTVTLIRLAQGKSPFVGDQQHFSHRLVMRGLSRRGAVIVIWGMTAATGLGGISMGRLQPWQAALVGGQVVLLLMVLALLEHASRRTVARGEPR
ncbi:MAG: MraY family glycosyltransferase [Planctomycetota bacterium]|nr:MraY family glycosyltransferase [Planctomycetota bacterium]